MLKVQGARKIQRGHSGMSLSSDPHKSACRLRLTPLLVEVAQRCETGKLECCVGGWLPGAACMCKLISMRLPMCSHDTVRLLCIVVSSYRRCAIMYMCVTGHRLYCNIIWCARAARRNFCPVLKRERCIRILKLKVVKSSAFQRINLKC